MVTGPPTPSPLRGLLSGCPPHSEEPREGPSFLRPVARGLKGQGGLSKADGLPEPRAGGHLGKGGAQDSGRLGWAARARARPGVLSSCAGRASGWALAPCNPDMLAVRGSGCHRGWCADSGAAPTHPRLTQQASLSLPPRAVGRLAHSDGTMRLGVQGLARVRVPTPRLPGAGGRAPRQGPWRSRGLCF